VCIEDLEAAPQISPLLRQNGIKMEKVIEVLRCDCEAESAQFVKLWDSITPAARALLGMEAMAMAADLTPRRVWELFQGAALMQSRESISASLALALPSIIRTAIKGAMTAKGFADREHIFKAARILPTPKGSTTNINVGERPQLESSHNDDSGEGGVLENADDFLMRASKAMNAKALPEPDMIDAELEDDE